MGLFNRARVRSAPRVDARVRARGDLADRDDRQRDRPGRARPHLRAAAGTRQGARAVGGAPAAGARRTGVRPGEARPDERDPRHLDLRAERLRLPGPGLRQQRDHRARRHAGAEGALALSAPRRRAEVGLLDDRAGDARLGPDPAAHACRPRRRRLRAHRAQMVHVERIDRGLPRRHGRHRPGREAAPARLDVHRARRRARREHRARRAEHGAPGAAFRHARRPHRDPLRGRSPRSRRAARRGGRRLPDRAAPARSRADSPLHALARRRAPRVRHALRAVGLPAGARRRCCATSRPCRTGSPTRPRRCRPRV